MMRIARELHDSLGYDLAAAVDAFKAAREAHRFTVDQPAPTAPSPLVEAIVLNGGTYEIVDPPVVATRGVSNHSLESPTFKVPPIPDNEVPLINSLPPPVQIATRAVEDTPEQADMRVPIITRRQFFHALFIEGKITQAEALQAVKNGVMPMALTGYLNSLPANQRFNAEMMFSGSRGFKRNHQLITSLQAYFGQTDAQMDQLYTTALGLK
jgi:hypothetical protein